MPPKPKVQPPSQSQTVVQLRESLLAELRAEVEKQVAPLRKTISELAASVKTKQIPAHDHDVRGHNHPEYVGGGDLQELGRRVAQLDKDVDHLEKLEGDHLLGRPRFKRQKE